MTRIIPNCLSNVNVYIFLGEKNITIIPKFRIKTVIIFNNVNVYIFLGEKNITIIPKFRIKTLLYLTNNANTKIS